VNNKHWGLYILKLNQGKYYVGITSKSVEERFWEHQHKVRAAYWTMKYKPETIDLKEDLGMVSKQHAEKYENRVTESLMKEWGVNNVRGGDFKDTCDYVNRFGIMMIKEYWQMARLMLYMLVVLAALTVDKYIVVFIPGSIR
jgi:predicted GIY-YIG superfamily endonuclease